MHVWFAYGCLFLLSCGSGPEKTATSQTTDSAVKTINASVTASDTDMSFAKDEIPVEKLPAAPQVKRPLGVYRFLLPVEGGQKVLHTVLFSSSTYRLQEEYGVKRDSIVVTQGTWAPSAGYIWLYKDQVVSGRYIWSGDTLEYYSPRLKKTFAMEKLTPARANKIWQTKKGEGVSLYAIGTEPFWSVELTRQDSLVLNMPDWNVPLRVKATMASAVADSTVYTAVHDSLTVTVYPLFCNDGMSDFSYTQKIKMVYKGKTYQGCGERLRVAN